ncbi:hypothetical protein K443DRAFT_8657 [Laccaria amethystina LaAM-08-1]|uniref:Uncharacterized protein n=2 Tax=Laccaria amethystina LaAM-08-1 TaxID=1095629 RepID=A0A0C9XNF1_9AGAR|nr:hypothetical protein K443DRAFT_8657 [Laccaria amethystina LaAM-08-1]
MSTCNIEHNWFTNLLTFGLCCGLVISYLPQHFRIINARSSEGFSPLFLLLGTTAATAAVLNMVTVQSGVIKCCRVVSLGTCLEITAGVFQLFLQWLLFSFIFVLYIIYYPPHLKYVQLSIDTHDSRPPTHFKTPVKSEEWKLSIALAWTTIAHLILVLFTTLFLLSTAPSSTTPSLPAQLSSWATFLGVSSALLAAIQYAPQLLHTYKAKVVGALSIPMMLIQSPGAVLMVLSIALRPGTNWTSWITFAVAGIMQGTLLTMCIFWKIRQRRLGIDDFGNPLFGSGVTSDGEVITTAAPPSNVETDAQGEVTVTVIEDAEYHAHGNLVGEETPLLHGLGGNLKGRSSRRWLGWLRR